MQNVHNLFIDNYSLLCYTIGTETKRADKEQTTYSCCFNNRAIGRECYYEFVNNWAVVQVARLFLQRLPRLYYSYYSVA